MQTRCHSAGARRARGGFSILELVVVLSLIALLTGAIAPSVSTMVRSKARRATLQQLEGLAAGSFAHFQDTATLPGDAGDLLTGTAAGWTGHYVSTAGLDTISGGSSVLVDAWSRPWQFSAAGDLLTIRSAGVDGAFGGTDDLTLEVDMTPVRRGWTYERMAIVNTSIAAYNALYLTTNPLPPDWATIEARLVSNGLLPAGGAFSSDGFGDAWVAHPAGATPVMQVTSSSL
jgi:general secretion pathway protein G